MTLWSNFDVSGIKVTQYIMKNKMKKYKHDECYVYKIWMS